MKNRKLEIKLTALVCMLVFGSPLFGQTSSRRVTTAPKGTVSSPPTPVNSNQAPDATVLAAKSQWGKKPTPVISNLKPKTTPTTPLQTNRTTDQTKRVSSTVMATESFNQAPKNLPPRVYQPLAGNQPIQIQPKLERLTAPLVPIQNITSKPATPTDRVANLPPVPSVKISSTRQPLKPNPVFKTKPVAKPKPRVQKPVPKLMDPEQFRVTPKVPAKKSASSRRILSQEKQDSLSDEQDSVLYDDEKSSDLQNFRNRRSNRFADDEGENSILNSLPTASLHAGIVPNSMQRATANRNISDPNLTFAANATMAQVARMNQQPFVKTWRSPDMVHRPLYFEDANLERYGNNTGRYQPFRSGVHFFSNVMLLPYQIGATSPKTCDYSMGHLRPGDCVPAYKEHFTRNRNGFLHQAAAAAVVFGAL
jgi:hypothetical protein